MGIKDKITEASEKIYDLIKEDKYSVEVNLLKKGTKSTSTVKTKRPTNHTKKWRAKNR
ncbi:hypothetical protein RV11_GL001472 [Enterococcus phoeniculicola]|jgi:uncharacterized protein (DUF169 family)|uniref:Uncharacterized protein n=1 Tax=Enterococcus phoeniculicola ATCC BAA-412 TaxID=1158610 RepID=R3WJV1_9ENTE|nr:hypothetical protein [Enterococcus phoeniculicola]EOL42170.1 hypothetical protein UC3_02518 [Enterococcus phoeniculicola ATCC BAA-412]EOT79551.1 hypothetical protein I589_01063 [Enterococcus phoeniculicola ATCC BAA-412]OJG70332.1 hypothetical protein RV11_GL001472 [Enterococcus phoeniculicola]